jgi:protein-disulfide isomerase
MPRTSLSSGADGLCPAAGQISVEHMASRKQQKEEARQRRLEQERAQTVQARRRQRMMMLVGVVVAAVVVVVVAVAVSLGNSTKKPPKVGSTAAKQTYQAVNSLLSGIPQSGTTLGSPSAKVTIDYYGDLECPICRAFTLGQDGGGFPQLVTNLVRTGKVKLVYKSFCTATCNNHPRSVFNEQQVAAYAAGQQKLFWDYAELFYHEQGDETSSYVDAAYLDGLAKQIPNLNFATWQADQKQSGLLGQVESDEAEAGRLGLQGTPSLVAIGPKHETLVNGGNFPTWSSIQQAVNAVS